MKKLLICLLFSTLILTACAPKSDSSTGDISNKKDKEVSENSKDDDNKKEEAIDNKDTSKPTNSKDEEENFDLEAQDMGIKVKDYILNGQGDQPEANKLKWSKRFLEKVDFNKMYDNYLTDGGTAGDVQWFAKYITLYGPIDNNWQEMFKEDVLETYNEKIISIKHLEADRYEATALMNGVEKPYVIVSARTGYYHAAMQDDTEAVKAKVQLYEGKYFDSKLYGENRPNPYCEIVISNITETSFDFTVYQVEYTDLPNSAKKEEKVIFLTNTASFIEDGTKAAYYGKDYTLIFTFPNNHNAYPIVTDINVTGFKPLEGNTYLNNGIPGHEFS